MDHATEFLKRAGVWIAAVMFVVTSVIGVSTFIIQTGDGRFYDKTEGTRTEQRVTDIERRIDRIVDKLSNIESGNQKILEQLHRLEGKFDR